MLWWVIALVIAWGVIETRVKRRRAAALAARAHQSPPPGEAGATGG